MPPVLGSAAWLHYQDDMSALLGLELVQAISQRQHGNLSFVAGSDPQAARANRERFCRGVGVPPASVVCAEQVHGDRVARVGQVDRGRGAFGRDVVPGVDALITDEPDVYPMLLFADCTPVLLHDPVGQAVGVAHAGWRGTSLAIAARTVEAMERQLGSQPRNLRALVGPCIGGCCYEVSPEVAAAVQASASGISVTTAGPRGRPQVDLGAANRAQLLSAGLSDANIFVVVDCTACGVERWFSHRAEQGRAGRFGALIGLRQT